MSPTPLHPKTTESTTNIKNKGQLKINRESHSVKKTPSSSSSPSNKSQQQRQPVIIYTHSPRIIQTNPRDFMALVQKLTGLSRSQQQEQELPQPQPKQVPMGEVEYPKKVAFCKEENGSNMVGAPPPLMEDPSSLMIPNYVRRSLPPPMFEYGAAEFLCSNNALLTYEDPLLF